MLTAASLLTVVLMTVHVASDVVLGMSPAGFPNLVAEFVFVVLLIGTLLLAGRMAGYLIVFLGSLLGLFILLIHMKGTRGLIGGGIGTSGGAFFFVWTLLALGVTSSFSMVLSARALLGRPWRRSRGTDATTVRPERI
jgi:hypothetical protein